MWQDAIVYFSGTKQFEKPKVNLKVTIMDFPHFGCMELIVYNPSLELEAPRIYINKHLWNSKISDDEIAKKLAVETEYHRRRNKKVDQEQLYLKIIFKISIKYVISRLNFAKNSQKDTFKVELTPMFDDMINKNTLKLDIVSQKPLELIPYVIHYSSAADTVR